MHKDTAPEKIIREVVEACADCDSCRDIMETCPVFPEFYRLWDREKESGIPISAQNLRRLSDLCNCCALCPCPDVRENIIRAKTGFMEREGIPLTIRILEDVAKISRICGALPGLSNRLLRHGVTGQWIRRAAGIHPERKFPEFPDSSFFQWAKEKGFDCPSGDSGRKVVFFAGCTGAFLFPEVPKAAVNVLCRNNVSVWVPKQNCCGMPPLLEGDRKTATAFAKTNLNQLASAVDKGYSIVTACPTCGFMLKDILCKGAWFSPEYQATAGGNDRYLMIPDKNPDAAGKRVFRRILRIMYKSDLRDEGYFAVLDPVKRMKVAENTFDLGEYLNRLPEFDKNFREMKFHGFYYPPCHLREQKIGSPFLNMLQKIPGIRMESAESTFDCCGMAGIMGFKRCFHKTSMQMAEPLMSRIKAIHPDGIITDCLSCRIQFQQLADYPVFHPAEILLQAYKGYQS